MNIKELKEIIKDLPDDMVIDSVGADSGGYDVEPGSNIVTQIYLETNRFYIAHESSNGNDE